MMLTDTLIPGRSLTYSVNGEDVGVVQEYVEPVLQGTATVHQVARLVGGSQRHALPIRAQGDKALCGAKPTGGFGSRGTWQAYRTGSILGVTCEKCQAREPTPAADLSLDAVLARCLDPADRVPGTVKGGS